MTSRFWDRLGAEHKAALATNGMERVKRVQALRYFTWRWDLRRALAGQARYILRRTSPAAWVRAVATPLDLSSESWAPVRWPAHERWVYALATRLLWEAASRSGADPEVLALDEPQQGSPFPVRWRGRLISQDLANTALEVASIREALLGARPRQIVEIGAGYGRTAHALLSVFPDAAYTIVDIPPALEISQWYLERVVPGRDVRFIDASAGVPALPPFDLAVTISSLHEMTHTVVDQYLAELDRAGRPGAVVYLKQWLRWWNPVDEIETSMNDYRLPLRWEPIFERRAPVQQRFGEAGWRRSG